MIKWDKEKAKSLDCRHYRLEEPRITITLLVDKKKSDSSCPALSICGTVVAINRRDAARLLKKIKNRTRIA